MNTLKRRKTIIQELEEEGAVKTVELSECLGVSSMTIRRDLTYLAEEVIADKKNISVVSHSLLVQPLIANEISK